MKRAADIKSELEALGAIHLLKAPNTMPYLVPKDYFSIGTEALLSYAASEQEEISFVQLPKSMPFIGPDASYFEDLSKNIYQKINNTASPEWSKENPFSVPLGYFDQLPATVMAQINSSTKQSNKSKRVPLFRSMQLAASIALIIFVGLGLMRFNTKDNTVASTQIDLSGLSKTEIANYVNANLDDFDTDLILNTLATTETKQNQNVQLSSEEIKNYLDENGWN